MFNGLKSTLRKIGVKMGLIKKLENVADHAKVGISNEFYNRIIEWRSLHRGYHKGFHDIEYHTVEGCKKRRMATLNMPKMVSQELATLIFNERCKVAVSDDSLNEFIGDILIKDGFNGNFQQYLEFMFAYGGLVIKPFIENNEIKLQYVTADSFLPVGWDNSRVTEGVFVAEIVKGGKTYTHLEWHTFDKGLYSIKNELFESVTGVDLGTKVPLNTIFDNLEPLVLMQNVKAPLFAYFKPNLANNFDSTNPLGISVFANSIDTLHTIDVQFDSLQREFRLGRKRIIVPTSAVQVKVDKASGSFKRYFDTKDETYEAMDIGDMDSNAFREINSQLRVTDHIDGINASLDLLAGQIGFNPGSFSFDKRGGAKTATEIISENSKTFRTKQSHENAIEKGITDLIEAIVTLSVAAGLIRQPREYEVTVSFDDSIASDINAESDLQIKLVASELNSRKNAIMKLFGLNENEAEKLMDEIKVEQLRLPPTRNEVTIRDVEVPLFGEVE